MNELVSVIIPTFRRSDYLCRAIDSVLSQTYKNVEIIVVDDNGRDSEFQLRTEASLQKYISTGKIQYVVHEVNKNGSAARNTGFRFSKGTFINFMDDDDYFKPNFLELSLKGLLGCTKDWGASFSTVIYTYKDKRGDVKTFSTSYSKDCFTAEPFIIGKAHFNTTGILYRREAIEQLRGFDESFRRHQDFELMIRFFEYYKLKYISDTPLYYMDSCSDGSHGSDIKNRLKFETDFLLRFEKELVHQKCLSSVSHFLYFQCASDYQNKRIDKYFFKSLNASLRNGMLSLPEIKVLFKVLVKQVLL